MEEGSSGRTPWMAPNFDLHPPRRHVPQPSVIESPTRTSSASACAAASCGAVSGKHEEDAHFFPLHRGGGGEHGRVWRENPSLIVSQGITPCRAPGRKSRNRAPPCGSTACGAVPRRPFADRCAPFGPPQPSPPTRRACLAHGARPRTQAARAPRPGQPE